MRPLIFPLSGFIAGLLVYASLEAPPGLTVSILFFVASLFIFLIYRLRALHPVTKYLHPEHAAFIPFFFLGAIFILPVSHPGISSDHIVNMLQREEGPLGVSIEGVVSAAPERKGEVTHLYVDTLKRFESDGTSVPVTGRIRLTVKGFKGGLLPGDGVRFIAKLSTPRNLNNPGGFDYEWWLKRRGVLVTGYVKDGSLIIKTSDGGFSILRVSSEVRGVVSGFLGELPLKNGGVIKALITGERSGINTNLTESFRRAGAAHILAISGLHIGIVAFFSYSLLSFILRRSEWITLRTSVRKLSLSLSLVPVLFYASVSGFSVSTQRATIMAVALVCALLLSRGKDFYNTIALAALIVLIIDPGSLWEAGFQLSFAALLGIVYLVPKLEALFAPRKDPLGLKPSNTKKRKVYLWIKGLVFVSIAASIATAPIAAIHFNRISLLSVFSSLVVIPLLGFIVVPVSLIGVLLASISTYLSGAVFMITDRVATLAVSITMLISEIPFGSFYVSTPNLFELSGLYLLVILFGLLVSYGWKSQSGGIRRYALAALAFIAIMLIALPRFIDSGEGTEGRLRVTFISVGQGDAAYIEFPGGKTMLIDGGGGFGRDFDMGRMAIAPFLWDKRVEKIDYMLLSHAQRDHMQGLGFIAENFRVGKFWWNGRGSLGELGMVLEKKGVEVEVINALSEVSDIGGVRVEFLGPLAGSARKSELDINEASVVIRLSYGKKSFLFTGDIGESAETLIIESFKAGGKGVYALRTDVLKVPHHGSRFSSSGAFLKAVRPEYAIVSAGYRNYFGFPHEETLGRYSEIKAKLYRTDLSGAITITTDGEDLSINTYLPDL